MIEERRRSPRYEARAGELVVLPFAVSVQVIDISVAGVLMESSRPVAVGTRGSLRLNVGGTPFSAEVEVRRVSEATSGKGVKYRIGASFTSMNPEHRHVIERFTN
jgi:hypothetical protein